MKYKNMKKQLLRESKSFVPDKKQSIMESLNIDLTPTRKTKQSYRFNLKPAYVFSFVLVFLLVLSFSIYNNNPPIGVSANAIVTIDVNPSIELEVDENDLVTFSRPLNVEAVLILEDLNLTGQPVNDAIDTIVATITENGYLDDDENQVMINAVNEDPVKEEALNDKIEDHVKSMQKVHVKGISESTREAAQSHNVSAHKMSLIEDVMLLDDSITIKEAKNLSIKALNEMKRNYSLEEINGFITGYSNKVHSLSQEKEVAINEYIAEVNVIRDEISAIKQLIQSSTPLGTVSLRTKELMEASFPDYDYNAPNSHSGYEQFLNELSNAVRDQQAFITELINDKYDSQITSFKGNLQAQLHVNNHEYSFEYEFDKDFSMGDFKRGNTLNQQEQAATILISRIETAMNVGSPNSHGQGNSVNRVESLMEELDELMKSSSITDDFRNSEIVVEIYSAYNDYIEN